jgi:hypothetical protein
MSQKSFRFNPEVKVRPYSYNDPIPKQGINDSMNYEMSTANEPAKQRVLSKGTNLNGKAEYYANPNYNYYRAKFEKQMGINNPRFNNPPKTYVYNQRIGQYIQGPEGAKESANSLHRNVESYWNPKPQVQLQVQSQVQPQVQPQLKQYSYNSLQTNTPISNFGFKFSNRASPPENVTYGFDSGIGFRSIQDNSSMNILNNPGSHDSNKYFSFGGIRRKSTRKNRTKNKKRGSKTRKHF